MLHIIQVGYEKTICDQTMNKPRLLRAIDSIRAAVIAAIPFFLFLSMEGAKFGD